jgi:hypothetical protein
MNGANPDLLYPRYEGLSGKTKSAEDAARMVGEVELTTYLAHSIREIECALKTIAPNVACVIVTRMNPGRQLSGIVFDGTGCTISIREPEDRQAPETEKKMGVRLILAHELGHLVYNFSDIKSVLEESNGATFHEAATEGEEVWAWRFARELVLAKGEQYRLKNERPEFVYDRETIDLFLKKHLTPRPGARTRISEWALEKILAPPEA